jgi:hypothetical protein
MYTIDEMMIRYKPWNDDLLSAAPIHASKTSKMGHQDMVYGMFCNKIHVEFYGLL